MIRGGAGVRVADDGRLASARVALCTKTGTASQWELDVQTGLRCWSRQPGPESHPQALVPACRSLVTSLITLTD